MATSTKRTAIGLGLVIALVGCSLVIDMSGLSGQIISESDGAAPEDGEDDDESGDAANGDAPPEISSCADQILSPDETDVDCGGLSSCKRCELGQRCIQDSDCNQTPDALSCVSRTCGVPPPTCEDDSISGDETDTDCGGSCKRCAIGKKCGANTDCVSRHCSGGTCLAAPLTPDDILVFVSSTTHTGNLGGLDGADQRCQMLAAAEGLPGTYKAFLSNSKISAFTRLSRPAKTYKLVNGAVVASNSNTFLSNAHSANIDLDEMGKVTSGDVWTGTTELGHGLGGCSDWTSTNGTVGVGSSSKKDVNWAKSHTQPCSQSDVRLYCIQQ